MNKQSRPIRSRLEQLAGYRRVLEARNPSTPAERLDRLAYDEIRPVRLWTARNLHTPPTAFDHLAQDEDDAIRWNVALNPNTPASALRRLADTETHRYGAKCTVTCEVIAHHPHASPTLKAEIVNAGACSSGFCSDWRFKTAADPNFR